MISGKQSLDWGTLAAAIALCFIWQPDDAGRLNVLVAAASGAIVASLLFQCIRSPSRLFFLPSFVLGALLFAVVVKPNAADGLLQAIPFLLVALQFRFLCSGFSERAAGRNLSFAAELRELIPERSLLFVDHDIETPVETKTLLEGHIVRANANELLPVDGVITFGSSFVEDVALSGEPEPRAVSLGKFVFAGSRNKASPILARVRASGSATFLARKAEFLSRPEGFRSTCGTCYLGLEIVTLLVLLVAALAFRLPASTLLALWLSASAFGLAAAGSALRQNFVSRSAVAGFLWRDSAAVKAIAESDTLVTDPTGVVTTGTFRLTNIATSGGLAEDGAIRLAGPLARRIENDAAYALLKELRLRNIPLETLETYFPEEGGGSGIVAGEEVRLADRASLQKAGISPGPFADFLRAELAEAGASAQFLLKNGEPVAVFIFIDPLAGDAKSAVRGLHAAGTDLLLVSPESSSSLAATAAALEVTHFHGECQMAELNEIIARLRTGKLRPIWLDTGAFPRPTEARLALVAADQPPGDAAGQVASWDARSVGRVFELSRAYARFSRNIVGLTLVTQTALLALALVWASPYIVLFSGVLSLGLCAYGQQIFHYRADG